MFDFGGVLSWVGAVVLAPWAEDGFEYEATVEEVDEAHGVFFWDQDVGVKRRVFGLKIRKLLFFNCNGSTGILMCKLI